MEKLIQKFDKLYIDEKSWESSLARRLRDLFPASAIEAVNERPFSSTGSRLSRQEFERSKKNLYLTEFKGRFFKRCPGNGPGLACCNYFVLNWGQQCDFNCSYCYLQSFLNSPVTTLYTNLDQALQELAEMGAELKNQSLRVGTGEVVDSLSLDPLTLFSHDLMDFFKNYPKWTLEFKTKSDHVEALLEREGRKNVIVSWSLNPQNIVETEEHGTASLERRLTAARKCLDKGYAVAFHIDPIIYHPEWRESYGHLVKSLTERFQPEEIPYMSLGALRYQPEQRHLMRERFGLKSLVLGSEMFPGRDGKLRYDQELRQEMFHWIMDQFRENSSRWKIFLCMETPETWLGAAQENPFKSESLHDLFETGVLRAQARAEKTRSANAP
jgi:spore photoproduct lyase